MIPTERLFAICETEQIDVEYEPVHPRLLGHYLRHPERPRPLITLHPDLSTQERLLRCVLGEELGHHFTGAGAHLAAAHFAERVMLNRSEHRAVRWAVDMLVPLEAFVPAVGAHSLEELADRFYVTQNFIQWQAEQLQTILMERQRRDPRWASDLDAP